MKWPLGSETPLRARGRVELMFSSDGRQPDMLEFLELRYSWLAVHGESISQNNEVATL